MPAGRASRILRKERNEEGQIGRIMAGQNHGKNSGGYFSQRNLAENARIFAIALRSAQRSAKVGDQLSVSSDRWLPEFGWRSFLESRRRGWGRSNIRFRSRWSCKDSMFWNWRCSGPRWAETRGRSVNSEDACPTPARRARSIGRQSEAGPKDRHGSQGVRWRIPHKRGQCAPSNLEESCRPAVSS